MKMKFRPKDLIEKIKANREAHRTNFEKALTGYKAECMRVLEQNLERVRKNQQFNLRIAEALPEDHTKDYDRVIAMLDLTTESEIELDQTTFDQYVMDNWDWKQSWSASNSKYFDAAAQ